MVRRGGSVLGILQSSRLLVLGLKQPWRIADIIRQGPQPRPLPPAEPQPCPQRCLASLDQARSAGSTERQSAFPDNAHISDIINPGPQPRPRPQICLASLDQARSTGSTEGRSAFPTCDGNARIASSPDTVHLWETGVKSCMPSS